VSIRHPSGLTLSRFADGELGDRRMRAVTRHVDRCARCREHVRFIRELHAAMEEPAADAGAPGDVARSDLADRVIRRRRAGERIELATPETTAGVTSDDHAQDTPDARGGWRLAVGIAAAFALFVLAGIYLFEAPPVAAGHSELSFGTELAVPGSTIEVTYTPSLLLAGQDSLRLRLRARSVDTPFPAHAGVIGPLRTATLHRDADGRFRGSFDVAPDELLVAAAVEDFSGEMIDTNLGRLWDLLVAEGGVPSTAALESRYRTLEAVNWVRAASWVKGLTQRYPDSPLPWAMLWRYQDRVDLAPPSDSLVAFHREKLHELIRIRARGRATPKDLEVLFAYARWLGEPQVSDSLLSELGRLDPGNSVVATWRALALGDLFGTRPYVERLDGIWAASDGTDDNFVINALHAAAEAGDSAAVRRWIARGREIPFLDVGRMAARLDPYEFATTERIRLRRDRLQWLNGIGERDRPLGLTAGEFEDWRQAEVQRTEGRLAGDLAATGDTAGALSILASVAATAWQPSVLGPYASLGLAAGDTAAALDAIAILAADPVSGEATRTTYGPLLERHARKLETYLRHGELEYARRLRRSLYSGNRLPGGVELHRADGTTTTAKERLSGVVTLVFIFEPELPGIEERIVRLRDRISETSGADSLRVLLVAKRPTPTLADRFGPANLLFDADLALTQHLHAFGSQDYVVLDRQLDASAPTADLDTALRIAGALRYE
jgi:hypothetical protein